MRREKQKEKEKKNLTLHMLNSSYEIDTSIQDWEPLHETETKTEETIWFGLKSDLKKHNFLGPLYSCARGSNLLGLTSGLTLNKKSRRIEAIKIKEQEVKIKEIANCCSRFKVVDQVCSAFINYLDDLTWRSWQYV